MEKRNNRKELALQLKKQLSFLRPSTSPAPIHAATHVQKGEISGTEIFVQLRLEQSLASQHLAILSKASFLSTERSGKQVF